MVEMIATRDLTKDFGPKRVVDGITLSVGRGEVLGFLGPNGAGKSTTMKMITGFLKPTSGSASICGFDVENEPIRAKQRLGYLPEGAPLYPDMTAAGFLRFCASARGLRGRERRAAIERAVERAQIEEVLTQPIETLSKGFKRRVGLAQALLHDPEVLILDEPTDGLDPNQKHDARQLIRDIAPEKAIIISTHILEEVEAICSRAIIIAEGRLIADGTPAELAARAPRHGAVVMVVPASIASEARSALASVPGVREVLQEGTPAGDTRLVVLPTQGARPAPEVAALARDRNWPMSEFYTETGQLDDLFRDLTRGEASDTGERAMSTEPREAVHA